MLILLRVVATGGLLYSLYLAGQDTWSQHAGDVTPAWHMAVCVVLGILAAISWAPYFGDKLSGPLAGVFTDGTADTRENRLVRWIRSLEGRRARRTVLFLCFLEGIHSPDSPAAFVIGFRNARQGSWLEKVFALEVFRFNNVQHCVDAHAALKRHGIDPGPHASRDVNVVLMSLDKSVRPDRPPLPVPPAPEPPPLRRNSRIRLFEPRESLADRAGPVDAGRRHVEPPNS